MATILEINEHAPDGVDVVVMLAESRRHVFHFPALPEDVQRACDEAEAALVAVESLLPVVEGEPWRP